MAKLARYEYNKKIYEGLVDADEIHVIKGSFGEYYEVSGKKHRISEVRFLPPVIPTKVVCVGQNYLGHIEELGAPVPKEPIIFLKPPSCLIGHEHPITYARDAERIDYEGELAIVIKHRMKSVNESDTLNYVLGYSCFNDVTERNMVAKNPFLLSLSKGFDSFGPFGPWIVTDLDPNQLMLKTYLNGEIKQQDNTKNCVFSVQQVLSFISKYMTLFPGDIVITGTPRGIAPMKSGDTVEVEIENIGTLRNMVQAESLSSRPDG
jgi:2-keto-4-pentenoate hydratase/2-oxohepta-3-ene-1,7-dioic acid hydratase in catechol pathway